MRKQFSGAGQEALDKRHWKTMTSERRGTQAEPTITMALCLGLISQPGLSRLGPKEIMVHTPHSLLQSTHQRANLQAEPQRKGSCRMRVWSAMCP